MTKIAKLAAFAAVLASFGAYCDTLPQVSVLDWTDSLDIVDYEDNPVTLDHAKIVHHYVDGVVQSHDAKYN